MSYLLCACASSPTEPVWGVTDVTSSVDGADPIIVPSLWVIVPAEDDPVRAPALSVEDQCSTAATTLELSDEGAYFDIDTTDCNWITVKQTSIQGLSAGDTLRVWAFRWANTVAEGNGHLIVAAGEPPRVLWQIHPALPNDNAELFYEDTVVTEDVPVGSTVYWHVSNHGQNVWSLIQLLRVHGDAE